ncbi:MAG: A/G-specific adenine glycosylase [Verrucomicrobiaceae bacterium]
MLKPPTVDDPLEKPADFRVQLREWFVPQAKDHPWRRTRDPWLVLISEIMLQQTTVASVIANRRFERFTAEFPDIHSIAHAPEEQLLRAWEGLGYYNRVRNLQKAARAVIDNHGGHFPNEASTLEQLPGIGKYTAGAVSSFSFDLPAPIVDANIARVLSRLFDFHDPVNSTSGLRQLWQWAELLLDRQHPRLHNSAIMELGQTFCSAKKPSCIKCPVASFCKTRCPEDLPVKSKGRETLQVDEHAIFNLKKGQLLLALESGSRRKGFWRLPLRTPEETSHLTPFSKHRYTITNHRVSLYLYQMEITPRKDEVYHDIENLKSLPIASPIRRAIQSAI